MRTITTELYTFSELSPEAQERALDACRYWNVDDFAIWAEPVVEDFERVAKILGLRLGTYPVKLMGGGTRYDSQVSYSDLEGASFEGRYNYAKGSAKAIREYAPLDTELHRIADGLRDIQRRYFWDISTDIGTRGRYRGLTFSHYVNANVELSREDESELEGLLTALADWLACQFENNYNYLISDEAVRESLEANEVEFTENGERA